MIEEIVREHLIDEIELPAYLEEPEKPPRKYMLIEKVGSSDGAAHRIGGAMIAVKSISADSLVQAALLNEQVKQAMWRLTENDSVTKVVCNSDLNTTDPETHRYRYQALFDIKYYINNR
jgi:hypothetical protein